MTEDEAAKAQIEIRAQFQTALDSLLSKVEHDPYVIGVVLFGSLSYDIVWKKSDIDLMIILQETKISSPNLNLIENGIHIHAYLVTRSDYKKLLEGSVRGSFMHSTSMKGTLVFSRDETLSELWENRQGFGARDREIRLIQIAIPILSCLTKAQKWLIARNDPSYSFFWITKCLDGLASIETTLAGEIGGREVLWQAIRINPLFFNAIYYDLIESPKTTERVGAALDLIETYLRDRVEVIFSPIFDYLKEAEGVRSAKEIDHHFLSHMGIEHVSLACEWLGEEGLLQKAASPVRLVEKSKSNLEEVAYYCEA